MINIAIDKLQIYQGKNLLIYMARAETRINSELYTKFRPETIIPIYSNSNNFKTNQGILLEVGTLIKVKLPSNNWVKDIDQVVLSIL